MDIELVKHAKDYIDALAKGMNPLTGEEIDSNDIVNNVRISRCLFYVGDILQEVIDNKGVKRVVRNGIDFYLDKEIVVNKYKYTGDTTISRIVEQINTFKTDDGMKNLSATKVCDWLIEEGLLELVEYGDKKTKIPTDEGETIGMKIQHRSGMRGEYDVVIYNKDAQEYIINNFDKLLKYLENL